MISEEDLKLFASDTPKICGIQRRFSDEQVRAIRADKRKLKELTEAYHTSSGTIKNIKDRLTYRSVGEL